MKIFSLLFTLFPFIFFSQVESLFITPDYSKDQPFIYQISSTSSLKSPKGKMYHAPYHTSQDVEVTYLFNDKKDKIFSWKTSNYSHVHEDSKKCTCQKFNYRNNITVFFRTDSLGRYKTINNLYQVKKNILDNISANEKELSKKDKKLFDNIKKNPEGIISNIEEDIIKFTRYFGIENKNAINTIFTRRNNFPFGLKKQPFKVALSVDNIEDKIKINVVNEFDKNKAEDDDYNIIRFNKNLEKEQKNYQLFADEEYVFSKENFRLLSAYIVVKEVSNFHDNGILDYQYSITKKE